MAVPKVGPHTDAPTGTALLPVECPAEHEQILPDAESAVVVLYQALDHSSQGRREVRGPASGRQGDSRRYDVRVWERMWDIEPRHIPKCQQVSTLGVPVGRRYLRRSALNRACQIAESIRIEFWNRTAESHLNLALLIRARVDSFY